MSNRYSAVGYPELLSRRQQVDDQGGQAPPLQGPRDELIPRACRLLPLPCANSTIPCGLGGIPRSPDNDWRSIGTTTGMFAASGVLFTRHRTSLHLIARRFRSKRGVVLQARGKRLGYFAASQSAHRSSGSSAHVSSKWRDEVELFGQPRVEVMAGAFSVGQSIARQSPVPGEAPPARTTARDRSAAAPGITVATGPHETAVRSCRPAQA
jgi:hypothetical protein